MGNQYRKLATNTILLAISTFSSKLLVFFLLPLYTGVMSPESVGRADMLVQTANLLLPVVSVGIMHAIVRFGLDKEYSRYTVFTTGSVVLGIGIIVFGCTIPLFFFLDHIGNYAPLLFLYVFTALLRSLFSQFVRTQHYIRLYALDGLLSTVYTIMFNVIFLVWLRMDVIGYLLAIIVADILSCLFLFTVAGLRRYFRIKSLNHSVTKAMLFYALPLIPTQMFWWITNVSDRFFITYMVGEAENGLYATAYKIPSIVSIASTIFIEAWQLSSVTQSNPIKRQQFFSEIFIALQGVCFVAAGFLIISSRFIMSIIVNERFFLGWQYIPILIIATIFSCFVSFLGSVYMVKKRSVITFVTMMIGAVANIILNFFLIPIMGVFGAAIATAISYFLVFVIRAIDTRRHIKLKFNILKFIVNILLLCTMCVVMIFEVQYQYAILLMILVVIIAMNVGVLIETALKLLNRRKGPKPE